MSEPRTAYDEHMDNLAVKISDAVRGEANFDVASACCAIAAYAIVNGAQDPEVRRQVTANLIELIVAITTETGGPPEPNGQSEPNHASEPKSESAPSGESEPHSQSAPMEESEPTTGSAPSNTSEPK
jgi:hypothetical protein